MNILTARPNLRLRLQMVSDRHPRNSPLRLLRHGRTAPFSLHYLLAAGSNSQTLLPSLPMSIHRTKLKRMMLYTGQTKSISHSFASRHEGGWMSSPWWSFLAGLSRSLLGFLLSHTTARIRIRDPDSTSVGSMGADRFRTCRICPRWWTKTRQMKRSPGWAQMVRRTTWSSRMSLIWMDDHSTREMTRIGKLRTCITGRLVTSSGMIPLLWRRLTARSL